MKLYAIVQSERASKGQGGNERLVIHIRAYGDQKNDVAVITVYPANVLSINARVDAQIEISRFNPYENEIVKQRIEYLRKELRAERISYGELAELQSLIPYIDENDVELLEASGVPEYPETKGKKLFNRLETSPQDVVDEYRKIKGKQQKSECTHLITKAVYKNKKLQGYECNSCEEVQEINPAYRKSAK